MKLLFLLEEESCKECLNNILPRILPPHIEFICVAHTGKSDLQRSIPIKLKGWNEPNAKFIIVHDQDNHNCIDLKNKLKDLCLVSQKEVLIRIVCTELESWYLGDLEALEQAYGGNICTDKNIHKFRNPDSIINSKEKLKEVTQNKYQPVSGSRQISTYMDIRKNKSSSFQIFVRGVLDFCK